MLYRGTFTLPRLNAHRAVLAAAALTTLVAAALATTLVVFSGQALPRSVRQGLIAASGTSMVIDGSITSADAAGYTAALHTDLTGALEGTPSAFYHAYWSDPLGLPIASGKNIPITEAATFDDVTSHAHLVAGAWPTAPAPSGPIPAALPANAAALLHVSTGEVCIYGTGSPSTRCRSWSPGCFRPPRGCTGTSTRLPPAEPARWADSSRTDRWW